MQLEDVELGMFYSVEKLDIVAEVIGITTYLHPTEEDMNVSLEYKGLILWINSKGLAEI